MSQVRNWIKRTFDNMSHEAAPEVHRIGPSGAHIVRVTHKRIEYTDAAGRGQFVDLEECARNWVRWSHDHSQEALPKQKSMRRMLALSGCAAGAILYGGPSS